MKNVAQTRWWEVIRAPFSPQLICMMLALSTALCLGVVMGMSNQALAYCVAFAGAIVTAIIVFLRWDGLAVTLILFVHLYVDWFLGLHLIGILATLMLVFVYYFGRSTNHPWVAPRLLWLWLSFLILTIYPAIYGGRFSLYDLSTFYPSIILGAFLMFWLGTVIVRDCVHLHKFFRILAGLGVFLAIHTIIQATTGIFLFGSPRLGDFVMEVGNHQFTRSYATRATSFLIDPNWNGTLLAMMTFLPLGLLFESSSLTGKILYFFGTMLMLLALLFTYTNGGWVGVITGFFVFLLFSGRIRSSFLNILFFFMIVVMLVTFFPTQINVQLLHLSDPTEVSERVGIWQTALHTIRAFPLMGVGLGYTAYLLGTQPFSFLEARAFSQPHDSYLEWAVMAGIPVLLIFVALLLFSLWIALRNWAKANVRTRALIACGMAVSVSLSMSSITINGWTHPVLAEVGWLVLGAVTSPLLTKDLGHEAYNGKIVL